MRIVHDNDKLISEVADNSVRIATPHIIFNGSIEKCEEEIEEKNLTILGDEHQPDKVFKPRIKKANK